MARKFVATVLATIGACFCAVNPVGAVLLGLSTDSDALYGIEPSSGATSFLGSPGGNYAGVGLAAIGPTVYATDRFFHIGDPWDVRAVRIEVDPLSSKPFTTDQAGSLNWHGLASDEAASVLYTIALDQPGQPLISIMPDGTIASIGSGTGIDGRGMAYDDQNRVLYATSSEDVSLYIVDPTTGTATRVGSLGLTLADQVGLAYDENSQILYANVVNVLSPDGRFGVLYTVDTLTGLATRVGRNSHTFVDGLVWLDDGVSAVPEPGALALFLLGLVTFAFTALGTRYYFWHSPFPHSYDATGLGSDQRSAPLA